MRPLLLCLPVLAACTANVGPDPRDGFTERNVGKTLITHVDQLGTQAVYLADNGALHVWSSASPEVQRGEWKYDVLATGAATTYQGAAGINHPVQELETDWGICFKYLDAEGRVLRRPQGGDWNCALFADYEGLVIERAAGDALGLAAGGVRAPVPAGARLTGADLAAL